MSPTEKRIQHDFDQLDELLVRVAAERDAMADGRPIHVCHGCRCELPVGSPCGAYCPRCAEEAPALLAIKGQQDRRVRLAFIVGVIVGLPIDLLCVAYGMGWLS